MSPLLSKFESLPFNCYELGHTWTPHCTTAAKDICYSTFKESLKIYTSYYIFALFLKKRYPKSREESIKLIKSIIRSSIYTTVTTTGILSIGCFLHKFVGKLNFFSIGLLSLLISYLAVLIEDRQRHSMLALYSVNVATETMFRMLRDRGIVHNVKHFGLFLYCLSAATIAYQLKKGGKHNDIVHTVFSKIIGSEEFAGGEKPNKIEDNPRCFNTVLAEKPVKPLFGDWIGKNFRDIFFNDKLLLGIPNVRISEECSHKLPCVAYWYQGFLTRFLAGFGIESGLQIAMLLRNLANKRQRRLDLSRCLRSGLGLSFLCSVYRLFSCSLRSVLRYDFTANSVFSSVLSSCCSYHLLQPNSTVVLCIFFKAIEDLMTESHRKNNWKIIQSLDSLYGGGWPLLYAVSSCIVLHAAIIEPHNLNPSYYKFILKTTGGYIGYLNRHLGTVYGTNVNNLMKDFWPILDPRFISNPMKKVIHLREASGGENTFIKEIVFHVVKGFI